MGSKSSSGEVESSTMYISRSRATSDNGGDGGGLISPELYRGGDSTGIGSSSPTSNESSGVGGGSGVS